MELNLNFALIVFAFWSVIIVSLVLREAESAIQAIWAFRDFIVQLLKTFNR